MKRALLVVSFALAHEASAQPLALGPRLEHAPPSAKGELGLADGVPGLVRISKETAAQRSTRSTEVLSRSLMRPWDPLAAKLRGARYWYLGRGFDAVICDDGQLVFHEKSGLSVGPTAVPDAENGGSPSKAGGALVFEDPTAMIERSQGHEPFVSERNEFLARTRELREFLADRSREQSRAPQLRALRKRLQSLWTEYDQHASRESRDTMLSLWEGCSDDDDGQIARALIEDFLREAAALRGVCPFSEDELARINAHRPALSVFSPCSERVADAGVSSD